MAALSKQTRVLVVGAGAMGAGIAHVAAVAGHTVYLYDTRAEAVTAGLAGIAGDLRFLASKGKMSGADAEAALARVVPTTTLADAADAGLAIEAIVENLEIKQRLFKELEAHLPEDAILATNTSSLSVTALASVLARPQLCAGLHFFNPAPRMKLVEVVAGLATATATAETLHATATAWGKVAVHARSTPGFIVNRVARPYYGEALRVLGERAADVPTLDAILREGCGFPMGPFELMDLIGHDVNFAVSRSVCDAYFGDRRFTPSLTQQELVFAGRLGRKSGRGFYDYGADAHKGAAHAEPACTGVAAVTVVGDPGVAGALVERLVQHGVRVERAPAQGGSAWLEFGAARLALSDGRTATRRAAEEACASLVLCDLCLDYATTPRIALARADQCDDAAYRRVVGTLQQAGLTVSRIDDVAGMLALRTVAMLANEAADGVLAGIGSAPDVDAAMRFGTNYPEGPLAWADRLGVGFVVEVLANLRAHYGEERYRTSPLLQRKNYNGERFHE